MEGHGAVDTAVRTSAAVRPYVNMERKMIACRVVAVCASGVALLCLAASASVAGLGATRLQLLESFGTGPDPDAPDAGGPFGPRFASGGVPRTSEHFWGKMPNGVPGGPRQQDYYYRHVYHHTGYPHAFPGASEDSENSVTIERLRRISGEMRSAEMQYANIDRQRAGVKASIAQLTKEEEGLNMEAKSAHEDLMRYTAEQQSIVGEMTEAQAAGAANATEAEGGEGEPGEGEEAEEAEGGEGAEGEEGASAEGAESEIAGEGEKEEGEGGEAGEGGEGSAEGGEAEEGAGGSGEEAAEVEDGNLEDAVKQAEDEDAFAAKSDVGKSEGEAQEKAEVDARLRAMEEQNAAMQAKIDELEKSVHGEAAEKDVGKMAALHAIAHVARSSKDPHEQALEAAYQAAAVKGKGAGRVKAVGKVGTAGMVGKAWRLSMVSKVGTESAGPKDVAKVLAQARHNARIAKRVEAQLKGVGERKAQSKPGLLNEFF